MDSSNNDDNNDKLIRYYKDRHVWLAQPDAMPATLTAYPVPAQLAAATGK
jgi:hypothetical protein